MLFGRHSQLVVKRVMPDLLHVVPVRHDAVLDRILERQNAALRLRFVADIRVLLFAFGAIREQNECTSMQTRQKPRKTRKKKK
jgi:hypothetical protein